MPPRRIRYHYTRPGRGTTVFDELLVLDRPDLKVSLLERYEGRVVRAGSELILEPGGPILWFVFPGTWHDVGRFHLADGTFTGWYTNLCTPVRVESDRWSCTDLFLDLWQPADGRDARWLDEDEFETAVRDDLLAPEVADRARAEQIAVTDRLRARDWPPAVTQEFDLARARDAATGG